ncbi:MaoC/PaaZ C-terminal domain-containing protein [Massilia sp. H6]|uniref:MaoC/PaaZ C-terminal domain-containing protein n=1 Tax=Massilia sp. H6 TaxID=2970464 RepID=UPI00216A62BF|nr:MaoC/PaaZ C-terminal domain-containing protein [Massilia sp. H6]UVW27772.1 MaoC/PaaZ C-terminal domain-containing protein [Massilia sp. H6]
MNLPFLLRALLKFPKQRAQQDSQEAMPDLVTEYRLDGLPLDDIARYRAAFGFAQGHVPVTWWYLLAQRAHLATMLEPRFPFKIVGVVHMDNALSEHGRAEPGQAIIVKTVLRLLPPSSSGALRCTLETTGSAGGAPVFNCTSTYLIRRGARSGAKPAHDAAASSGEIVAQWTLDAAAGRRYARLSGDWNPIHLTGWSARLMGMRTPIIHGMHTLAASCAALEQHSGRHATSISCRFRAPIALGSSVSLRAQMEAGAFVVEAGGQPAVTGNCALA